MTTLPLAVLAAAGCGADEPQERRHPRPTYERALADAPPPLARLYSRPNELARAAVRTAFERTLRGLRGYPVVVNKWASWCGPCRFEFPFFQKQVEQARQADRVPGGRLRGRARGRRASSCEEFPVPYPSFFDPDERHRRSCLGSSANFPTTTFYDRRGELVYTKPGGYASEAALADDIARIRHRGRAGGADNEHVHAHHRGRVPGASPLARLVARPSASAQQARRAAGASRSTLDLTINPASAGVGRRGARRRRERRRRHRDLPPRHAGRPRRLDARHRQGHHRARRCRWSCTCRPNGARAALRGPVHHRGGGRGGDGARRRTSARRRRSRSAAASRTRCSAARSATTPPPTCARWRRATAATATSPSRWCATPSNVTADRGRASATSIDVVAADEQDAGARARRLPGQGPQGADARDHRRADRVARRAVQVRRCWSCW